MATYTASDFIGKTIFITGNVPLYPYAARKGEAKPTAKRILTTGDSFVVDSYINENGTYVTHDDNYWSAAGGGVVAFKDITGKYNTQAVKDQGIKSDAEKAEDAQTGPEKYIQKYGKWVLIAAVGVAVLRAVINKSK
jgi:hypothetical protein